MLAIEDEAGQEQARVGRLLYTENGLHSFRGSCILIKAFLPNSALIRTFFGCGMTPAVKLTR